MTSERGNDNPDFDDEPAVITHHAGRTFEIWRDKDIDLYDWVETADDGVTILSESEDWYETTAEAMGDIIANS